MLRTLVLLMFLYGFAARPSDCASGDASESGHAMMFERLQQSSAPDNLASAPTLAVAGRTAYQKALNERLALAHIAEQSGRAQYWFANNLLQVVDAYGSPPAKADHVLLTRDITGALKLSDDMMTLTAPGQTEPRYFDLRVTADQFDRYMDWARTVA